MPFPNRKGRPKGSLNQRTENFLEVLERNNFNAAQAMIDCYKEAKKIYDNYGVIYDALCEAKEKSGNPFPIEDRAHTYLKIAGDLAKEIAQYSFPKLKAIEKTQTPTNPLIDLTPEQKVEALQKAIEVFKAKTDESKSS